MYQKLLPWLAVARLKSIFFFIFSYFGCKIMKKAGNNYVSYVSLSLFFVAEQKDCRLKSEES